MGILHDTTTPAAPRPWLSPAERVKPREAEWRFEPPGIPRSFLLRRNQIPGLCILLTVTCFWIAKESVYVSALHIFFSPSFSLFYPFLPLSLSSTRLSSLYPFFLSFYIYVSMYLDACGYGCSSAGVEHVHLLTSTWRHLVWRPRHLSLSLLVSLSLRQNQCSWIYVFFWFVLFVTKLHI